MTREERIAQVRTEHAAQHAYCVWRRNPRAKYGPVCHDPCHRAQR